MPALLPSSGFFLSFADATPDPPWGFSDRWIHPTTQSWQVLWIPSSELPTMVRPFQALDGGAARVAVRHGALRHVERAHHGLPLPLSVRRLRPAQRSPLRKLFIDHADLVAGGTLTCDVRRSPTCLLQAVFVSAFSVGGSSSVVFHLSTRLLSSSMVLIIRFASSFICRLML